MEHFNLKEGPNLVLRILNYINDYPYSTNSLQAFPPSIDMINGVLKITLSIKLTPTISHSDLVKNMHD